MLPIDGSESGVGADDAAADRSSSSIVSASVSRGHAPASASIR
jgi:hypothetical protein